jgi:hypothetical protein
MIIYFKKKGFCKLENNKRELNQSLTEKTNQIFSSAERVVVRLLTNKV